MIVNTMVCVEAERLLPTANGGWMVGKYRHQTDDIIFSTVGEWTRVYA